MEELGLDDSIRNNLKEMSKEELRDLLLKNKDLRTSGNKDKQIEEKKSIFSDTCILIFLGIFFVGLVYSKLSEETF